MSSKIGVMGFIINKAAKSSLIFFWDFRSIQQLGKLLFYNSDISLLCHNFAIRNQHDGPDLAAAPSSFRASFCLSAIIYLLIESEWSLFLSKTYAD
jgi:hypothetical protein